MIKDCDVDTSPEFVNELVHVQHGLFGRKLLDAWKLPRKNGLAAEFHESPEQAPSVSKELLAVHLGNLLSKNRAMELTCPTAMMRRSRKPWPRLILIHRPSTKYWPSCPKPCRNPD